LHDHELFHILAEWQRTLSVGFSIPLQEDLNGQRNRSSIAVMTFSNAPYQHRKAGMYTKTKIKPLASLLPPMHIMQTATEHRRRLLGCRAVALESPRHEYMDVGMFLSPEFVRFRRVRLSPLPEA